MRLVGSLLVLSICLAICPVYAESLPTFRHVIIVVQENRTPDNLFGSRPTFEPGVDLQQPTGGQWCLGACFDPDHSNAAWHNDHLADWCKPRFVKEKGCRREEKCNGLTERQMHLPSCPPKTYVSATYDHAVISPYFDIARKYGFANYMFQSNEGPSFPAHQFLFSGTSAPSGTIGAYDYQYFAAENPSFTTDTGCTGDPTSLVSVIDQYGSESNLPPVLPCFRHHSLPTLLDANQISWKYYSVLGSSENGNSTGIWTAPDAIYNICVPQDGKCSGPDWENVVFRTSQILHDLGAFSTRECDLKNVSWVIPNGDRSDHPGLGFHNNSTEIEHGPAWVSAIVNALGRSRCTDRVNGRNVTYWQDTAIFILWDDWGGFYDHVAPYEVLVEDPDHGKHCDPALTFGCGYVSGFRVPLLVVSAYTPAGYVSGSPHQGGKTFPYIHDFGSILAFVENNFLGSSQIGGINRDNNYPFADAFAPDYVEQPLHVPLADFFPIHQDQPRPFQSIILPSGAPDANYFLNYSGPIEDPDNDAIDND